MKTKVIISTLILISICALISAQNPTGRIIIVKGSQVTFTFNSYSKIKNGITFSNYSRLNVFVNDTNSILTIKGWQLKVRATNNTFYSDYNSNPDGGGGTLTPPLNSILFSTSGSNFTQFTNVPLDSYPIDDGAIIATCNGVDFTNNNLYTIDITYDCGTSNEMFGFITDYFSIDLEFILETIPL